METAYVPQLETVIDHEKGYVYYGYRETEGAPLTLVGECNIGEEDQTVQLIKKAGIDTWEGYQAHTGFEKLFPPLEGFTNKLTIVAIVMEENETPKKYRNDNTPIRLHIKGSYTQQELEAMFKALASNLTDGEKAMLNAALKNIVGE